MIDWLFSDELARELLLGLRAEPTSGLQVSRPLTCFPRRVHSEGVPDERWRTAKTPDSALKEGVSQGRTSAVVAFLRTARRASSRIKGAVGVEEAKSRLAILVKLTKRCCQRFYYCRDLLVAAACGLAPCHCECGAEPPEGFCQPPARVAL